MQYEITETLFELTPKSNPEQVRGAATDFLLDHMGNQLTAGTPYLMVAAIRALWIVPVQLGYIHTGTIGTVGVIAVDDETAQVVGWTPIAQMKSAIQNLRENREPELSESFQTFMQDRSTL